MGVLTSEVGYTAAMPRWEDHEVHKDMWWHWGRKISIFSCVCYTSRLSRVPDNNNNNNNNAKPAKVTPEHTHKTRIAKINTTKNFAFFQVSFGGVNGILALLGCYADHIGI